MSLEGRGEALGGRSSETQALGSLLKHVSLSFIGREAHFSLGLELPVEPELGMKKCCHLVDIFCNYNLPSACLLLLLLSRFSRVRLCAIP